MVNLTSTLLSGLNGIFGAALFQPQAKSPAEQLVKIMMQDTEVESPYNLLKRRTFDDYQVVYDLVLMYPELLQGIIHDGQTFALLCIQRGYSDLLTSLINENLPVDLTTPCNLCGLENPQTTVLHVLFGQIQTMQLFEKFYPEDYINGITELTKLIINKCPDLLDMKIDREKTARESARYYNLDHLIQSKAISEDLESAQSTCEDIQAATKVENQALKGSLEEEFIKAVESGDLKNVDSLIAQGICLETRNSENMTALMIVSKNGDADIAKRLIDAGAHVGAVDAYDCTALFYAAEGGCVEIVDLLIAHGAAKGLKNFGDLLVSAVFKKNNEMAKALLVEGSKIDQDTLQTASALSHNCSREVVDAIKELLKK